MRKIFFGLLAVGIAYFYFYTNPSSENEWIYGTWNIDKQVKKSIITNITFKEDGTMTFGNKKGIVYNNCTYEFFTRSDIDFTCYINGKQGTFSLKVNYDNTEITDSNSNTYKKT